jgi:hypothetical protein
MTLTRFSRAKPGTSGHMFCGIGGDTKGFQEAGWEVAFGANHSARNIETFGANFPGAETLCQDMDRYDMRNLPQSQALDILGYNHVGASVSAAHIAGPDNESSPQWRDRAVGAFVKKGIPLPDLTPRPLAKCTGCCEDVDAIQAWKDPTAPRWGKFGLDYHYVSPHTRCRQPVVKPYVRPVLEVVDWSNLGPTMSARPNGSAADAPRAGAGPAVPLGLRDDRQPRRADRRRRQRRSRQRRPVAR